MVNKNTNIKESILKLLFQANGQTLSGVKISEKTGISRVAVWKHIKALKASGAPIETRPRGYAIVDTDNLLMPFCFGPEFQDRIFHYQEVESTMDIAKTLAREGASHLSCCVAELLTKGRGRLNRKWVTAQGGLWFTLILKPDIPPHLAYIYNFSASLCLSRVVNRLFDLNTTVKWPNDLLLNGQKLTGLLSEMETQADLIKFLVIGIGINVNNDPSNEAFTATSIKNTLGKSVPRRQILIEFLKEFQDQTQEIDIPNIMSQWRDQTSTIGTNVTVQTLKQTYTGKAIDVDDQGTLTIETDTKESLKVVYGDCFHT